MTDGEAKKSPTRRAKSASPDLTPGRDGGAPESPESVPDSKPDATPFNDEGRAAARIVFDQINRARSSRTTKRR